jgi:hypothetical protein
MYQPLGEPKSAVMAFRITGEMSDAETRRISRGVKARATRFGRVRLLLMMDHYASFNSAEALYEDLRFARQCSDHIARMAIVGDRSWKRTWVALFGLFSAIDTAYFDLSQSQAAWRWLVEKDAARGARPRPTAGGVLQDQVSKP